MEQRVEEKKAGVSVERLHEDRLWVITIDEFTNENIDSWVEHVRTYQNRQAELGDATKRDLVYDASKLPRVSMTSYLRRRSTELAKEDRPGTGRLAIVLSVPSMIRYIIDMFLSVVSRQYQPKLKSKLFADRQEAIAWVEEAFPEHKDKN